MASVLDIQQALQAHGFDPGPLDGVMGRLTLGAIRAFQLSRQLMPDGIVGPLTAAELFDHLPIAAVWPSPPPWHQIAQGLQGTREIVGPKHNSLIMGWAKRLGLWYASDETAWCGLFLGHCIAAALPNEPLPANPLGARNWLKFGVPLAKPAIGAVLVFHRGSPAGWEGHVGLYAGESATTYKVLGGNQSNSVSITDIAKSRLLGMRWPASVSLPRSGPVKLRVMGALSTNEA